ncbi:MAG: hypothetical protein KC486_07220 [Myxococcales bacterium]|nr:hypothetical protein [Myxococcales bacterium]
MLTLDRYLAINHRIATALPGRAVKAAYRVDPGEDDPACEDIGDLVLTLTDGELFITVDEGRRNIILFDDAARVAGLRRPRGQLSGAETSPNVIDVLTAGPLLRVVVLRRPRGDSDYEEGHLCGLALTTRAGEVCVGAYLTELDDAGVCVLDPGALDPSVERTSLP